MSQSCCEVCLLLAHPLFRDVPRCLQADSSLPPAFITDPFLSATRDSQPLCASPVPSSLCSALWLAAREACCTDTARFKRALASLLQAGFTKTSVRGAGASQSPQDTSGVGGGFLTKPLQKQMYLRCLFSVPINSLFPHHRPGAKHRAAARLRGLQQMGCVSAGPKQARQQG